MKTYWIKKGILCGLGIIACVLLCALAVQLLWNWLMPALFPTMGIITYCQALGVLVLSKILFGSFPGRGCCGSHRGGYWRSRFKANWEGMSEEEREKLRKCCDPCCPSE